MMRVLRRLTFLFRPSWLILAVVVVAFAYLCFTVLAPWQLGKNNSTSHRNDLIAASVNADPVPAATLLTAADGTPPDGVDPADTEWRRVDVSGSYVPDATVVERLQRLNDKPAFGVLSAFRLDDGRMVLVDRGLIAAVDGTQLPVIPEPPSGPQHLAGRIRHSEGAVPGKEPMVRDGVRQVYSVDTTQVAAVLDTPLASFATGERGGYLQLDAGQAGAFTPPELPQLDAGPYLSYGLQWIAFGVMAPLGLGYFVYAELRERRRDRAAGDTPVAPGEPASADATETATTPGHREPAPTGAAGSSGPDTATAAEPGRVDTVTKPKPKPTTADRLADRYGNTRH